jgi:glycosyltransferase involved in cell wall biosynthesis
MSELVSVVIVGYNNWPDLEMAIQSALCQSYTPAEVIVIDNSSTDATPEEVPKRFGGRIRYVRQPNRGDSGAYNTGMALARGQFIQFLDGDDVLSPNKIEKQIEIFLSGPGIDIVYSYASCFQTHAGGITQLSQQDVPSSDRLEHFLLNDGQGAGTALGVLFRRAALERVGLWDETMYCTDADYELRALWLGCHFRFCPISPCGFYRIRPGQMSGDVLKMLRGREALWGKGLTYIDREPYLSVIRQNLARTKVLVAIRDQALIAERARAVIREARSICRDAISLPAYFCCLILVSIPWGRRMAISRRLRTINLWVARCLGIVT